MNDQAIRGAQASPYLWGYERTERERESSCHHGDIEGGDTETEIMKAKIRQRIKLKLLTFIIKLTFKSYFNFVLLHKIFTFN